jgi:hypothetical protein
MAKNDSVQLLQDKIALLKEARRLIENRQELYICYAIYRSTSLVENTYNRYVAADKLCSFIQDALEECYYFGEWFSANRKGWKDDMDSLRQYRLQWITWMIACLQEDLEALASSLASKRP